MHKLKKFFSRSITRELLIINIISFVIVIITVMCASYILMTDTYNTSNMINDFNSLYADASRAITTKNSNCEEYLNKLSAEFNCSAVITDLKGNIVLKSQNINYKKIDLNKIYNILEHGYKEGSHTFYQVYNIALHNQNYKLIVFKNTDNRIDYASNAFYIMIAVIFLVISAVYFLTRKKAKYIKEICHGIKIISGGDLNYRIKLKGSDELYVLAKEINNMSDNLKCQMEEERTAENLKSELITNVSHDLRTPLSSLTAYLQLANDNKTSSLNKQKYTKIAEKKAGKLKDLIEDLFEYSKLESGGIKLQKNQANLIEIIEQSIGELSLQAKDKNINFNKNFAASSIVLNIDSGKMARVFENIISNAIKYSPEGSIINIYVSEKDSKVTVSIQNTSDIELSKDIARIFERFYRCNKSRSLKTQGSGLGLAIAKSIVELHNGHIYAKAENNTVTLTVLLKKNC